MRESSEAKQRRVAAEGSLALHTTRIAVTMCIHSCKLARMLGQVLYQCKTVFTCVFAYLCINKRLNSKQVFPPTHAHRPSGNRAWGLTL